MLGFLHVSDLHPRTSWDSHECLLVTYRASTGHSLAPLLSFPDMPGKRELGDTCLGYGTEEGGGVPAQWQGMVFS